MGKKRCKRSRMIIIVPMTSLILFCSAGCQSEKPLESKVYTSVRECIQDRYYIKEYCETQYEQAKQQHQENAPQYNRQRECEDEYGNNNCQPVLRNGSLFYIPYMRGFILGRDRINQPIYGSASSGYRSRDGVTVKKSNSKTVSPTRINSKSGKSSPRGGVTRGNYGRSSSVRGG